jgi:hypothetical protein
VERRRRKHAKVEIVTHGKLFDIDDKKKIERRRRRSTANNNLPTPSSAPARHVKIKVGDKVRFRTRSGADWITKDGMVLNIEGCRVVIKSGIVTWSKIYDKKKGLMADQS